MNRGTAFDSDIAERATNLARVDLPIPASSVSAKQRAWSNKLLGNESIVRLKSSLSETTVSGSYNSSRGSPPPILASEGKTLVFDSRYRTYRFRFLLSLLSALLDTTPRS